MGKYAEKLDTGRIRYQNLDGEHGMQHPLLGSKNKKYENKKHIKESLIMKKINVDFEMFKEAFGRDRYFLPYQQETYMNLETGAIVWVYDNNDDVDSDADLKPLGSAVSKEMINKAPTKYLRIPGQTQSKQHEMLKEFLESDWTDDELLWEHALSSYSGSIGKWIRAVKNDQEIISKFMDFRWNKIKETVEEFLNKNGIIPIWQ